MPMLYDDYSGAYKHKTTKADDRLRVIDFNTANWDCGPIGVIQ